MALFVSGVFELEVEVELVSVFSVSSLGSTFENAGESIPPWKAPIAKDEERKTNKTINAVICLRNSYTVVINLIFVLVSMTCKCLQVKLV